MMRFHSRILPAAARMFFTTTVIVLAGVSNGCAMPMSPTARAQEAVTDLNMQNRFGRLDVAASRVAPEEQQAYAQRHRGWGSSIRVVDTEVASFRILPRDEAEVLVRVAWYRPNEGELLTTTLRQTWKDHRGTWLLRSEERSDGASGIFGETSTVPSDAKDDEADSPRRPPTPQRFPTIRIGETNESP